MAAITKTGEAATVSASSPMVDNLRAWAQGLCQERAVGLGLIVYAIIAIYIPLWRNDTARVLIETTGFSTLALAAWYLLSGLFLLWKGRATGFIPLVVAVFPVNLQVFNDLLEATRQVDGNFIAGEIMLLLFMGQLIVTRLIRLLSDQVHTEIEKKHGTI